MPNELVTKRDPALDVAKGLMMVLLVFHHFFYIAKTQGIQNDLISTVGLIQGVLCTCYFMQAFFLISGMVSNFDLGFKDFVIRQARGLFLEKTAWCITFRTTFSLHSLLRLTPTC